jgi:phage-related protein
VASIADAYVDLHVNGDSIEPETTAAIKGASPKAEKEGEKLGGRTGDKAGDGFLRGFKKRIGKGEGFLSAFKAEGLKAGGSFIDGFRRRFSTTSAGDVKKSFQGMFSGLSNLKFPAIGAAIPFITSGLSALAGSATALVGALAQAGGATAAFLPLLVSLKSTLLIGKLAFQGFSKAVSGDAEALKALSPNARLAAKAVQGLGKEWNMVKGSLQQATFRGLNAEITKTGKAVLPVLQARLAGTGRIFNDLFRDVAKYARSKQGLTVLNGVLKGNNAILGNLRKAAVPVLNGVLHLLRALQPAGGKLSKTIVGLAKDFNRWASSAKGQNSIRSFMERALKSATHLAHIFVNLGKVLHNVFGAATKPGDTLLKVFDKLTGRLADFTSKASTKNAIAEWAKKGIAVTGRLFTDLGKIGKVLLPLFNPNISSGYLSVFEAIGPVVVSLVKVFQDALAPVLQSIGKSFAENGPKFEALFVALKPLLGGVLAVIGQIITQALSGLAGIAVLITPVVKILSNILGPILQKLAPVIAFLILGFTNLGGTIVRLVPFVGKFLAPMVELYSFLWSKLTPIISSLGKFIGPTFKFIGKAISGGSEVAGKAVSKWFGPMARIVESVMGVIWKVIKAVWSKIEPLIGPVLKVVGRLIETYFKVYRKVIETVMRIVVAVIRRAWSVVKAVVLPAVRLIGRVIDRYLSSVRAVWTRVWGFVSKYVSKVWGEISKAVEGGVKGVTAKFHNLIANIISLASNFLSAGKKIGSNIARGVLDGLRAIGSGLGGIASDLKSAINNIIGLPKSLSFSVLGKHIGFTIPGLAKGTQFWEGGPVKVGEHGPETLYLPRGSAVDSASKTRASERPREEPRGLRKMILRIGSRDFEAYLDDRIEAYDSLVG